MTRDADNDHDDKRMDIGQIQMETIRITLVDKQNTKQKQPILYMLSAFCLPTEGGGPCDAPATLCPKYGLGYWMRNVFTLCGAP